MFSRKVPNAVLNTSPNLKSVILLNNPSNVFNNFRNVKERMKTFINHDKVLRALRNTFVSVPRTLKNQSAGVLRVWAHQCECVFAQRLRRGQQMFCLYTKLWEERALRELLRRMQQQIAKRGKEIMFSAVGVTTYNWDSNRITSDELMKHLNELDYIHMLTEKTMVCEVCKEGQSGKKDLHHPYCECGSKTSEKKTFDDWVPFIEKLDMLVWRKMHKSGHYEYKVYGSFNDVSAEDFLNVQIDSEYRKKWDTTAITLKVVEKDPTPKSNSDIVYWEMLWPKLFENRDYVFNRRFMINCADKTIVIMSRGTKHPACPIRPDKCRVDHYWSCMVIKPYTNLEEPGIEFGLTYYDNPGVNIPQSVTAWVAMRAMPDFLTRLRDATKKYKGYCTESGNKCMYNIQQVSETEGDVSDEQMEEDETDEIIIDNTIYEPQHSIATIRSGVKTRCSHKKPVPVPVEHKVSTGPSPKASSGGPGTEVMTSPSPMMQAESERRSYWKYLRPNYYFS